MSTNDPQFQLRIGKSNQPLDVGITQLIQRIEYESADGLADAMRLVCTNTDFAVTEAKVFQPGNELGLYIGYGNDLEFVGRAIVAKVRPNYPSNGMPTVAITAYTKDFQMMDNSPEGSKGRRFRDVRYSQAVEQRAGEYGFEFDIDPTPDQPHSFIQKSGMSDYEFVKGLSNITGFVFWVDGDRDGQWTLHFKNPEILSEQDQTFTFRYNQGDLSSLLSFEPQLLIRGFQTKISVRVKDVKTGRVMKADVEEDNNAAPDVDGETDPAANLDGEHTTASDIKLFINDFSFDVVSNRKFKSEAEVVRWAQQWFRRQRENFVLSRGTTVGVETVMSRQTHTIDGVGGGLSGQYYFTKVKHVFDVGGSGYILDFGARKVVPS